MTHPQTTGLTVFSTLAVRAPFDRGVLAGYQHHDELNIAWNPTTVIEKKLQQGQHADVVIATDAAIARLVEQSLVSSSQCFPLARAYCGVAVAAGQTPPDIASEAAFFKALTQARSVAYSLGGASGIYLQKLLAEHGVLEQIEPKATRIAEGFTASKLLTGEADLAVQQMSELMTVEGITIVGAFPPSLQHLTPFTVAIMNRCTDPEKARGLVDYLLNAHSQAAYTRNGLMCR